VNHCVAVYLNRPSQGASSLAKRQTQLVASFPIENASIAYAYGLFPVFISSESVLRMKADWKVGLDNRAHIHVTWLDQNGETLESEMPLRFPIGSSDGPLDIHLPMVAPNNAYDVRIRVVVSRQYAGDFLDISQLDFGVCR